MLGFYNEWFENDKTHEKHILGCYRHGRLSEYYCSWGRWEEPCNLVFMFMGIRKVDICMINHFERWVAEKQFPVYIRRWGLNSLREHKKHQQKHFPQLLESFKAFPTLQEDFLHCEQKAPQSMAGKLWSYNINTNIDSILRRLFLFRQCNVTLPLISRLCWDGHAIKSTLLNNQVQNKKNNAK